MEQDRDATIAAFAQGGEERVVVGLEATADQRQEPGAAVIIAGWLRWS
jgi:hypothetical protein